MAVVEGVESTATYLEARCARLRAIVLEVVLSYAPIVEAYMKQNAAWQDRTGEARRQLTAYVDDLGPWIILWAAHGVEYGIFLETMQQGRFAILLRALRAHWAPLLETIQQRWQEELGAT